MAQTQAADFRIDTKAASLHVEDDGSVVIEGMAADFGEDRQDEAFLPGAFDEGVKSFLESNPALLYHHQFDKALGRVLDLQKRPDGWWMKAVIDPPAPGSWAEDVVEKVKRGTIKGLSVGGKFYRKLVDGRPRIFKTDLMEVSVTPMPVNPRTMFAVAGKAFENVDDSALEPTDEDALAQRIASVEALFARIDQAVSQRHVAS